MDNVPFAHARGAYRAVKPAVVVLCRPGTAKTTDLIPTSQRLKRLSSTLAWSDLADMPTPTDPSAVPLTVHIDPHLMQAAEEVLPRIRMAPDQAIQMFFQALVDFQTCRPSCWSPTRKPSGPSRMPVPATCPYTKTLMPCLTTSGATIRAATTCQQEADATPAQRTDASVDRKPCESGISPLWAVTAAYGFYSHVAPPEPGRTCLASTLSDFRLPPACCGHQLTDTRRPPADRSFPT